MSEKKPIPYGKQTITEEDIREVARVLQSDFLTQGPAVSQFEKAFAEYVQAPYAVAVANGTAALHLSVLALGLKPGEKVLCSPITFAASSNCVLYAGGVPVFADIHPETFCLDPEKAEDILRKHPKGTFTGIIPVDMAGYPVTAEDFRLLADKYAVPWIIEDACHAPGAYFTGKSGKKELCGSGKYSDLTVFSFHPVKHIATGEGGMITTRNRDLYDSLMRLRTHGITKEPQRLIENHGGWYYEMQELGYNYRLTDIQAALGFSQLKRADQGLKRRNLIAERYNSALSSLPGVLVPHAVGMKDALHAYHLYIIRVQKRKELYDYLREKGIFTQVHYIPVHIQPYYKNLGWKPEDCPNAMEYYSQCLSLPMYPGLSDEEQDYVIEQITQFCS